MNKGAHHPNTHSTEYLPEPATTPIPGHVRLTHPQLALTLTLTLATVAQLATHCPADARTHEEPALCRGGVRNSAALGGSSRLCSDPKSSGRGNGGWTHSACRDGSTLSVQPRSVDPGGRHTRFDAHDYPARHAGSAAVCQSMAAF